MSIHLQSLVANHAPPNLSRDARAVLLELAKHADDSGHLLFLDEDGEYGPPGRLVHMQLNLEELRRNAEDMVHGR